MSYVHKRCKNKNSLKNNSVTLPPQDLPIVNTDIDILEEYSPLPLLIELPHLEFVWCLLMIKFQVLKQKHTVVILVPSQVISPESRHPPALTDIFNLMVRYCPISALYIVTIFLLQLISQL